MRNACLMALAFLLPATALAQTSTPSTAPQAAPKPYPLEERGYAAVHIGGQAASSSLRDAFSFSIYDETAAALDEQEYGGGFLFNIEGGYFFTPRWGAGLAITQVSGDTDARITARIPHPQLFDTPRDAALDVPDTNHSETGFHFFAAYKFDLQDNVDLRVFAGPSVMRVKHDLPIITANNVTETAPFTSVTLTGTAPITERSATVGAFHVGAGGTYHLTDRFGVDGFFRFARGTTEEAGVGGGNVDIKVGGAQFGIGVRVGF